MMFSYPCWVRFQGRTLGLVWQSEDGTGDSDEDTDRVLTHNGRIVSASTVEDLSALAIRHGLGLQSAFDPECGIDIPQDLDGLEALLELPVSDGTCAELLNAWNLFADIARGVGATLDDRGPKASKCYDKIFYGNNLECITPAGEHYSPHFSASEIQLIAEILDRGRTILSSHLQVDPEREHAPGPPHRNY